MHRSGKEDALIFDGRLPVIDILKKEVSKQSWYSMASVAERMFRDKNATYQNSTYNALQL